MKSEQEIKERLSAVQNKIDSLSDLDMRADPESYDRYMTMKGELEGVLEIDTWERLNYEL